MTNKEKIEYFIDNNALSFTGGRSAINSSCTILAGYCDYLEETNEEVIYSAIRNATTIKRLSQDFKDEFERVFRFAQSNLYGTYWTSSEAQRMYKFKKA